MKARLVSPFHLPSSDVTSVLVSSSFIGCGQTGNDQHECSRKCGMCHTFSHLQSVHLLTSLLLITAGPKVDHLDVPWPPLGQKDVLLLKSRELKNIRPAVSNCSTKRSQIHTCLRDSRSTTVKLAHIRLYKCWLLSSISKNKSSYSRGDKVSTGLRSQWIIFSLCSICRHRRRAWVNRRMRARLKPWKLFFLMSSYKFTLKKEKIVQLFLMCYKKVVLVINTVSLSNWSLYSVMGKRQELK